MLVLELVKYWIEGVQKSFLAISFCESFAELARLSSGRQNRVSFDFSLGATKEYQFLVILEFKAKVVWFPLKAK